MPTSEMRARRGSSQAAHSATPRRRVLPAVDAVVTPGVRLPVYATQILALAAVLLYLPLAIMSDSLPQARLIFYATLAVLAVIEVLIGSLLIHGAFKRKPQFTWPWLVLAWWKGLVLIVLTVVGMVMLTLQKDVSAITEATAVISVYFVYSALLLYFAVVVNSRRQELVHENYWANKHMLRHAKTQYYYV